jgi:thymidylate synthase ThyX
MTTTAKLIAHSISPDGIPLMTMQLRYPKFIHGEFLTHRVFSRNSSSSRAIPVDRLIKDVMDDPVIPAYWGANQKGMQADKECNNPVQVNPGIYWGDDVSREKVWLEARDYAIEFAKAFSEAGYHKQIVNRLIEPWCHINTVVTATEWTNFFDLRCHKDAQPEMRMLAEAMRDAMAGNTPLPITNGNWHLPYVSEEEKHNTWLDYRYLGRDNSEEWDFENANKELIKLSVARCARVSYLTQEGKTPSIQEDLALYDRLVGSSPLHASPCEHQATPDQKCYIGDVFDWEQPHLHGNFKGWIQYRRTLPGGIA